MQVKNFVYSDNVQLERGYEIKQSLKMSVDFSTISYADK